jgi:hypothetical protein
MWHSLRYVRGIEVIICSQNFLILFQDFPWIETDEQENEVLNANITPIKTLDTGLLKLQMYVEESDKK